MSKETMPKAITKISNHVNKVAPTEVTKKGKSKRSGNRKLMRNRVTLLGNSTIRPVKEQNPSWITSHMSMRECIRFKPADRNKSGDNPKCKCGKPKLDHAPQYRDHSDVSGDWKVEKDTERFPTNAYGEIEFVGSAGSGQGQQKLRKYVRVDYKTKPKDLLELIQTQWNLGRPKLLISVTGGAQNFPLNSSLKDVFRKGLIKAALSTGAWIITGGSNSGVMKYVGEAVRDYAIAEGGSANTNIVAIGIATWGILDQQQALIDEKGRWPASYRMDKQASWTGLVRLDPNHTHFILVDDGTTGAFGKEIKLRSALEKEISEQKVTQESNDRLNVPSVCVVVQGGPNTIATVYEAVKNDTPCLIIAGSGRAADILAYAFGKAKGVTRKVKEKNETVEKKTYTISEGAQVRIAEMLSKEFGEKDLDLFQTQINECIQKPHLINVYKLDAKHGVGSDIDGAILHALLKANKGNAIDQLQLALVWNRVDVAKREIFTDDKNWEKGELNNSVRYAIEHNLPSFLELFIENGVSMNDYLTDYELTTLYSKIKPSSLLSDLLKEHKYFGEGKLSLLGIGLIIQQLTMDTFIPLYLTDHNRFGKKYQGERPPTAADTARHSVHQAHDHSAPPKAQYNPLRELFLYSILLNRRDMARLLWERLDEAIAAALTATKILKEMASKEDDIDQKESMMQHASVYEELAIGVLNECYDQEEDRTHDMLIRELPNWGCSTCLTLAVQAQNRKFIAQSPVQNLLTQIWMGKISDENSYWKLWLFMFCPPAVVLGVWFREDEHLKEKALAESVKVQDENQFQPADASDGHEMVVMVDNGGPDTSESRNLSTGSYEEPQDVDIRDSGRKLSWWHRLKLFYNAPIIKFRFNVLSYFGFLFLFSFIILTEFDNEVMWKEWLLIGWVVTLYLEEFRQIAHGESKSWSYRILHWISDFWNMVDVATLLLFGVGVVLRCFDETVGAARIILALDLMIFYMRLLQSFSVSKNLGPKLIMIARMMVDLLFFVCILAVFLIGYGVASQAIMFPNETDPMALFKGIFYHAYFQMYGELFLENIEGEGCSDNMTLVELGLADPCPEYSWMGILLLTIYMMLSNVLLLNLLIAMFSYTFSNVQDNTDEFWKFQRYEVINEFFNRPPIPPPFIIISLVYFFFRACLRKCCPNWRVWSSPKLKQHLSGQEVKQFILWEGINADNFIAKENYKSQTDIDERLKVTGDRVQNIFMMVDKLLGDPEVTTAGTKSVEDRLTRIEKQLKRTDAALDWIMKSMIKNGQGLTGELPDLEMIEAGPDAEESDDKDEVVDEVPTTIEELGLRIHTKARKSPYPGTAKRRFHVSDDKVDWKVAFPAYKPINYTHASVLKKPFWADEDLMVIAKDKRPALKYNQYDPDVSYNRQSYVGEYQVKDGLPLNPKGRTGVIGRGILGRFGPNHAADPVVTRFKRDAGGNVIMEDGKPVLEFVAIQRKDNQQWAFPGGMVEPGHEVSQTLLREFSEEALGVLDKTEEERKALKAKVEQFFKQGSGREVYKGYVDDPRNTDNAWMETVAMNFHDADGSVFAQLEGLFQAGDDAQGVRWQKVSSEIDLFASHTAMLDKVAQMHKAAF